MAIKRFYRRRFLNLRGHHAGAYVIADCGVARTWNDPRCIEAELTVSDCSRVVALDFSFDVDDEASVRNSLHKARTLLEVVQGFVDALEAAREGMTRSAGRE
jgi:hypothetical protein